MTAVYPAPWDLCGDGYMFFYHFPERKKNPPYFKTAFSGNNTSSGFGAVMLVDYHTSNAGPYQELLFIPGMFGYKKKKYYSITKIYVSTMESVVNGRNNWGIPKERADFEFKDMGDRKQKITVIKDGATILQMSVKHVNIPFPVSTRFFPFPLLQFMNSTLFHTRFHGHGKGKPAWIENIDMNPEFFPDIADVKPLAGIKVEKFAIEFPVPEIWSS